MAKTIRTVQGLFDALGGASVAADRYRVTESAVRMWKTRGKLPSYLYRDMTRDASKLGFAIHESLWPVPKREAAE